jgi:hypothetical protein
MQAGVSEGQNVCLSRADRTELQASKLKPCGLASVLVVWTRAASCSDSSIGRAGHGMGTPGYLAECSMYELDSRAALHVAVRRCSYGIAILSTVVDQSFACMQGGLPACRTLHVGQGTSSYASSQLSAATSTSACFTDASCTLQTYKWDKISGSDGASLRSCHAGARSSSLLSRCVLQLSLSRRTLDVSLLPQS